MASSGVPHSMVVGLAMSWKTTTMEWGTPFHGGWLGDVLEDNSSASLSLVFHQLHAMGALLPGLRLEVFSKSVEGLIVPVEVGAHGKINVRGIEFHVDLLVDQCLAVLVVVLPDLRHGHLDSCCSWSLGGWRKS